MVMHGVIVALIACAWLGSAAPAEDAKPPTTGMWVGLRGGPPKLRTALAAALQTQASIRGIIDRVAPDLVSLQACTWNDVDCFVRLGEHHESRVLLVGDLSKHEDRWTLRVARINVDLGQVIAQYHLELDATIAAIDIANQVIAGLTGEVVAAPRTIATPTAEAATAKAGGRSAKRRRASQTACRTHARASRCGGEDRDPARARGSALRGV
jgi:hypothetical protein